jgi:hypothetical protein
MVTTKLLLDRPIAFHRVFVTLTGSVTSALFLSQSLYWQNRCDGWFWKTQEQWEDETGLSRREQESARNRLKDLGLIHEERRGSPAKLYFQVDLERVQTRMAEIANLEWRKPPDKNGGNRQPIKEAEITSEITSETINLSSSQSSEGPKGQDQNTEPKYAAGVDPNQQCEDTKYTTSLWTTPTKFDEESAVEKPARKSKADKRQEKSAKVEAENSRADPRWLPFKELVQTLHVKHLSLSCGWDAGETGQLARILRKYPRLQLHHFREWLDNYWASDRELRLGPAVFYLGKIEQYMLGPRDKFGRLRVSSRTSADPKQTIGEIYREQLAQSNREQLKRG